MNYKSELIPRHSVFLVSKYKKVRGATVLARVIGPVVLEEAGWLLHNDGSEQLCVDPKWLTWIPPGTSLPHCNCEWRSTAIPDRQGLTPLKNEGLGPITR